MDSRLVFGKGYVFAEKIFYFSASMREWDELKIDHSFIICWNKGKWSCWQQDDVVLDFGVYQINGCLQSYFLMNQGYVKIGDSEGFENQWVDDSIDGVNKYRSLIGIRLIEGYLYAFGSQRMIYRKKIEDDEWSRFDDGIRVSYDSKEVSLLKDLKGSSQDELYAVGMEGEIWWFNGSSWIRVISPTNLKLESILIDDDGQVYIAGGAGIVLKGRYDCFEVLQNDATAEVFWKIVKFDNRILLSTLKRGFFEINLSEGIVVKSEMEFPKTTYFLDSNKDVLLSTGSKNLGFYTAGKYNVIYENE